MTINDLMQKEAEERSWLGNAANSAQNWWADNTDMGGQAKDVLSRGQGMIDKFQPAADAMGGISDAWGRAKGVLGKGVNWVKDNPGKATAMGALGLGGIGAIASAGNGQNSLMKMLAGAGMLGGGYGLYKNWDKLKAMRGGAPAPAGRAAAAVNKPQMDRLGDQEVYQAGNALAPTRT